jgi:toxin CptA
MSIAISVVTRPSQILRFCLISFALFLLSIGLYIGALKNISLINQSILIALCCFAAWRSLAYNQKIAQTSWRISIGGQGQLHCQPAAQADDVFNNQPCQLLAGSTLWTHALFLRLHNPEENVRINLVILSDALSRDEFRRLSIACKWIVVHAGSAKADTI